MSRLFRSLILIASFATVLAADTTNGTGSNNDDKRPIGGFVPKKLPAYIALALYAFSGIIHWFFYFTVRPRRPLALPLGMTAMATGFVLRVIYSNPPFTLGKYIAMDLFILLSPCLFLAADYVLLSHLAATFDEAVADRCLIIRRSRIVKIFVWSDVSTFFLQSSGGALTATKSTSLANLGNKIAMIGLILQAVSFLLFTVALIIFGVRLSKHYPELWHPKNPRPFKLFSRKPIDDWRIVFYIMCVTCVGVLIRSVFRVAEFGGGYNGTIATHEGYFYAFDTLPLWIAMTLYCFVWPTRAFMDHSGRTPLDSTMELNPPRKTYA
ncbi:RTA1 like protein-domain-containing protein [Mycena capillaripes]|nr:RTA1 like protein-domain-containing protein [Mycena capillaripes]